MTIILGNRVQVLEKIGTLVEVAALNHKKIGILAPYEREPLYRGKDVFFISLGREQDPLEMGRNLFEGLRQFDDMEVDVIFAEGIKETGVGKAVMNRLKKASGFQIIEV